MIYMKNILSLICGSYRALSEYKYILDLDRDTPKISNYCHRHYITRKIMSRYDSHDKYYRQLSIEMEPEESYISYKDILLHTSRILKNKFFREDRSSTERSLKWVEFNRGYDILEPKHPRLSSYTHKSYY